MVDSCLDDYGLGGALVGIAHLIPQRLEGRVAQIRVCLPLNQFRSVQRIHVNLGRRWLPKRSILPLSRLV